jgi:N-acetylglutamate synthase-like GNAT family acetyltransferase
MTAFSRAITDREVATQVASLINFNNRLNTIYTSEMILQSSINYIIESVGNTVIACIKIERQSYNITELKHLVVTPTSRGLGLGKTLVKSAMNRVTTPIMYAMIRHDNIPSQMVFSSCGFSHSGQYTTANRDVLLFTATGAAWKKVIDTPITNDYINPNRR